MRNNITLFGKTAIIEVKKRDGREFSVYIDKADLPKVLEYDAVHVNLYKYGKDDGLYYAALYKDGKQTLLHRVIMGVEGGSFNVVVDHKDHDTLNNQQYNLEVVTRGENLQNRNPKKTNKTGIRGVTMTKNGKYVAQVRMKGVTHYLGTFTDASKAGDVAAKFRAEHMPFSTEGRALNRA